MKYPDVIYATEKFGSNGINCLDYKNYDDDVKYIRADLIMLQNKTNKYDEAKLQECCLRIKNLFKKHGVNDDWNYCPVCGTMIYDVDYL